MKRLIFSVLAGIIATVMVFATGYQAGTNAARRDAANNTIRQAARVHTEEHAVMADLWTYEQVYQKGVQDNEAKYNNLATRILRGDFGMYPLPAASSASRAAPAAPCASAHAEAREFRRRFDELLRYAALQARLADQVTADFNMCAATINRFWQATTPR